MGELITFDGGWPADGRALMPTALLMAVVAVVGVVDVVAGAGLGAFRRWWSAPAAARGATDLQLAVDSIARRGSSAATSARADVAPFSTRSRPSARWTPPAI
ncbi:hypothetical protein [Streptomyces radicis]|nr:hypothetical protein [Streptomyces radicis]